MIVAGWIQDLTKLIDVLIWPLVVVFALAWAASRRGRSVVQPLLGRVRKVGAGGFSLELSEENARSTKASVEIGLEDYGGVLNTELDRLAHVYDVRPAVESVVEKVWPDDKPDGLRATIHIRDPLIADALHQLVNYYLDPRGAHRRWSIRFGILGQCWRLRRSTYEPAVPDEPDDLIVGWGMTREQATEAGKGRQSFMCYLLRSPPEAGPDAGMGVGVLYLDATPKNAFGAKRNDFTILDDAQVQLGQLAEAVAGVDKDIRKLGPSIKVLDK